MAQDNKKYLFFLLGLAGLGAYFVYKYATANKGIYYNPRTIRFGHSDSNSILEGSGIKKEKTVLLQYPINQILMRCMGTLEVVAGPKEKMTVSADDNIIDRFVVSQEQEKLVLTNTQDGLSINAKNPIIFLLETSDKSFVRNIVTEKSGDIQILDSAYIDTNELFLQSIGSGHITVDKAITLESSITIDARASGDIEMKKMVNCSNFNATLFGSGKLLLDRVCAHNIVIHTHGSGDVQGNELDVQENLNVSGHASCKFSLNAIKAKVANIMLGGTGDFESSKMTITKILNAKSKNSGAFITREGSAGEADIQLDGSGDFKGYNFSFGTDLCTTDFKAYSRASGSIKVGTIKAQNISATLAGSGDFSATTIQAGKKLHATSRGSGKFTIGNGSAAHAVINLEGSGDFKGAQLIIPGDCKVITLASGKVSCTANGAISGSLKGSGNFKNSGRPQSNTLRKNKLYKEQ